MSHAAIDPAIARTARMFVSELRGFSVSVTLPASVQKNPSDVIAMVATNRDVCHSPGCINLATKQGIFCDRNTRRPALETSKDGKKDLAMDMDSITGYSIINAESLDEAESIARENPFIASIRVYEIVEH